VGGIIPQSGGGMASGASKSSAKFAEKLLCVHYNLQILHYSNHVNT